MAITYRFFEPVEALPYLDEIYDVFLEIDARKGASLSIPPTYEDIKRWLTEGRYRTLLAFDGDAVIAFSSMTISYYPNYLEKEIPYQQEAVGMILYAMVSMDYRGKGIHKMLVNMRRDYLINLGLMHIYAVVNPANLASLKSLTYAGLDEIKRKDFLILGVKRYRSLMYFNANNRLIK